MKNRHRAYHYLLLLSMPLCVGIGETRAQTIAELARQTSRPTTEQDAHRQPARAMDADGTRPAKKTVPPISDDGNGNERLLSTSQLIISSKVPMNGPLELEILDDQGHTLQHRMLSAAAGQTMWPIDVQDLQRGRYMVRVSHADGALVSRFRRE